MLRFAALPWIVTTVVAVSAPPAAYADAADWFGLTCGLVSSNDPIGVVDRNPDRQHGAATAGPWFANDVLADDGSGPSAHIASAEITITCTVQVNNSSPGGDGATVSASGTGFAFGAGGVVYTATPWDNVFLCTKVEMSHNGITETYHHDEDDDPSNGIQCPLAISVENVRVVVPSVACSTDVFTRPFQLEC